MVDKIDRETVSYVFGVASIVLAFFTPLMGIVVACVGIFQGSRDKSAKRGMKMSKIGLILNIVVIILSVVLAYVLNTFFPDTFSQIVGQLQ